MLRTASILLSTSLAQGEALRVLRAASADACNRLVPTVIGHRCWNRVALHNFAYSRLREETNLGSQTACNAIFSVVAEALRSRSVRIAMEDLTHIRDRIQGRSGLVGKRVKHRFVCGQCGFRAHADSNASRNLGRIGGTAVPPRAVVSTPDVGNVAPEAHVLQ